MEKEIEKYVDYEFDTNVLPALMSKTIMRRVEYIAIPNLSPSFDADWEKNGNAQKACDHIVSWIKAQNLAGCKIEVIKEPTKTHLIIVDIDGTTMPAKTVVMYAHWDKQPPLEGKWAPGLGAFTPVVKGDLLYGRGSADDGYGNFAAVLAIKACQNLKLDHPRIVMVFESCEESEK